MNQEFENYRKKNVLYVFYEFTFLIILFSVLCLVKPKQNELATMQNFDTILEKYDIPVDRVSEIEQTLFTEVSIKYPKMSNKSFVFNIRNKSDYIDKIDDDASMVTFMVDNDLIKETFTVSVSWSKSGEHYIDLNEDTPNVVVSCPKKSDMKYPETFCRTTLNSTDSIELYVPYSGDDFNISRDNGYTKAINLNIKSCSKRSKSEIRKEAWEYINSTGIDQDEYEFVEKEYCNES